MATESARELLRPRARCSNEADPIREPIRKCSAFPDPLAPVIDDDAAGSDPVPAAGSTRVGLRPQSAIPPPHSAFFNEAVLNLPEELRVRRDCSRTFADLESCEKNAIAVFGSPFRGTRAVFCSFVSFRGPPTSPRGRF